MGSAKLCGLLTASILLLTLLTDLAVACMCMRWNPAQSYCDADFVLKAQFQSAIDNPSTLERRYKITITQVLKGPKKLKEFRNLYTALPSDSCGYVHPTPFNKDEYVVTGKRDGDRLTTIYCDFNMKWNSFSDAQKKGLKGGFRKSCH